MEQPPESPEAEEQQASRLDALLGPFLTDSLLWPVAIVSALAMAMFGAAILLLALERNPFAWAALLGLVFVTVDGLRGDLRRRHLGPGGAFVLIVWGLAIAGTVAGLRLGVF